MTREEIEAKIAEAEAALSAINSGQSYTVDGQTVTRADSTQLRQNLAYWRRELINFDDAAAGQQVGVIPVTWR